jgi:hypothetical protein
MDKAKIFPLVIVIINLLAAVGYIPSGDWRKTIYYICVAILTIVVTW